MGNDNNTVQRAVTETPTEKMDDHQLLALIAEKSVRAERHRKIAAWALVIIAACVAVTLILVVPQVLSVLSKSGEAITNANSILEQIKQSVDGLGGVDFNKLADAIEKLQEVVSLLS